MILSPEGTAENSPGRKPWDCEPFPIKAPEGRQKQPGQLTSHRLRGLFSLILLLVGLNGCAPSSASTVPVEISGSTMGTYYNIKLTQLPQNSSADQLQSEIDARLETINDQMSTWRDHSELSRFNAHTGTDWFKVSFDTALVLAEANRISRLSNGAFDVTVGPLVNVWNFGERPGTDRIPTDEEIATARQTIGFHNLEVRMSPPALRKTYPEIHVNLSAIAKGFAVDNIAEYLDDVGISGYMIDIGGEVKTHGTKPDGTGWIIGIQSPLTVQNSVYKSVALRNASMATSGDYRNYFEKEEKRYSHTIDPRTGRPVDHHLASVSVVHKSCMTADALATAIMVLGPEAGYNLALREQLPVLLLVYNGDGLVEKSSPPMQRLIAKEDGSPMTLFLITLVIFAIAILGMSVGVLFSNRRLKGTCGGLAGLKDEQGQTVCDACTNPFDECAGVETAQKVET
ncbi:MAG: FAD:protein FMN transferase [Planctomycetes bacterium]|nr:FAD:protein FMN transferase [Planctomycetota bacterium]